jgi:lysophospholipase L1-like esterase
MRSLNSYRSAFGRVPTWASHRQERSETMNANEFEPRVIASAPTATTAEGTVLSRRAVLGLGSSMAIGATGASVGLLGGAPAAHAQVDDPTTPLGRLQMAIRNARPPVPTYNPLQVTQGPQNSADSTFGSGAVIFPTPRGNSVNPNPVSLADMPQVWGYRRDTWTKQTAGYVASTQPSHGSWYVPVSKTHRAATMSNSNPCGLHFIFTGRAFEVLFAGQLPQVTLIADGRYMAYRYISTAASGAMLSSFNCFTRFDFGSRGTRRVSLYGSSTQGPCAIAIGPQDEIQPWARADEPSFCAMADSYGSGGFNWGRGGPFWEAAALLGIPHLDLNAMGGTGYAPNMATTQTRDPGNAFRARIPDSVSAAPDLFLTAGSTNDNNWLATPPLYNTAAAARASFNSAVAAYFTTLRASLPRSVLAAMGPWTPRGSVPLDPIAQSKLETIRAALQAVGGPWVFLDNLSGGWINSAGMSAPPTGQGWQTGSGTVAAPNGDGNADIYVSADGTHPTPAGCAYLGEVLASNLRAAILAL